VKGWLSFIVRSGSRKRLLKKLMAARYKGPIGLQCYQVPGDVEDNLKRSMAAWRKFQERM
jgi:hypothetical protein